MSSPITFIRLVLSSVLLRGMSAYLTVQLAILDLFARRLAQLRAA